MTIARAWIVSILVTIGVLALVVGLGATTGQFGFGDTGTEATGGMADGPFVAREEDDGEEEHDEEEHEDDEDEREEDEEEDEDGDD